MLELILGKDHTANTDEVLRRLAEDVAAQRGGRIVLVPELISHDMERRLCEAAGDTASRYAEVLSFTRLARRVSEGVGSAAPECLDAGGRVVAMAAAARQLHSRLKAYAALETRPEFLTGLVDAVDEFKRCRITSAELKNASLRTEGALAQKLEELSLLMESYDALCQRGKRDPRDLMDWVLEELEDSDVASRQVVYIDGFPDLTRQNLAIVEHFIRHSPQVTVSLNCDRVGSKLLAFEKAGATASELVKLAQRAGIPVKITMIDREDHPLAPVRERSFQGPVEVMPELADRLCVRTAGSLYRECEAAAGDILKLIRGGARYRDISVVCTDMAAYRPVVGLVFRRAGIPIYLSGTEQILDKGVITTVLTALEAVLDGFEQRAVLRYLRCVLSPLDPDTCDLVENHAVIWGITGGKWKSPWKQHPDGLNGEWDDASRARLDMIEQARAQAIGPLAELREVFRGSAKLSDQVLGLYSFLERIRLAERSAQLAEELRQSGDDRGGQILDQLWDILVSALEQMYDVLGQTYWEPDAFLRLLILLLGQYDVGTIPSMLDAVTVGPVSAMRCQRQKHLFVLGAAEGSLPAYGGSKGILTDQERVALRELDVQLTGGALEGIQAEFAEVYGVFCGTSETVTVSCPTAQPSFVYRRLRDMVGSEGDAGNGPVTSDPFRAACWLAKWDDDDTARSLGLWEELAQVRARKDHALGRVRRENVDRLYGRKLTMSASQVDRQAECKLSYFLKYGLRAQERKEATVDPAEFGTYVHYVLEHTVSDVMARGGFHQVSLEETMTLAKGHSDAYVQEHFSELDSKRVDYLFRRNIQELDLVVRELWEELSAARFDPIRFELHFGKGGEMPPIRIPSTLMEAQLQGFVDRVDSFRVGDAAFFRVVDYKTGKKDFDHCDVFNGVGLQMLLYLFALEQEGEKILGPKRVPAGVQYFPARVPYVALDGAGEDEQSERRRNWVRKGLLLSDDLALDAMDPQEGMPRLCCKRNKDGILTGDVADRDQLRMLRKYVSMLLGRMVDQIASGEVDPDPYTRGTSHDACAFCPYGAVCHKESVAGRRNYKTMEPERFWEEIRKEVGERG